MIQVNSLSYSLNQRQLFDRLSFQLPKGSITAILGPNGRGKTTLLRMLLGLQTPAEGCVKLSGPAAYVPQQAEAVFSYSVLTMVQLGRIRHMKWFSTPSATDCEIAMECLALFGLSQLADKPFNQLSGGERQLVTLARALAGEPEILILDEPGSALDLYNQDHVLFALQNLAKQRRMTVVFTTHHPQHALHIADYTLLLHADSDCVFDKSAKVLTNEQLERLYRLPVAVIKLPDGERTLSAAVPLFR